MDSLLPPFWKPISKYFFKFQTAFVRKAPDMYLTGHLLIKGKQFFTPFFEKNEKFFHSHPIG